MASAEEQNQTTLEFYQAMADFKNMFPQMDDDVIEAVLRSNQGAVNTTIDQLLAMSTDNENEKIRSELEEKLHLQPTFENQRRQKNKKMFITMINLAVLRSNQGAVNTTIDQLLAMSTDNENEKIRSELEENEEPSKIRKVAKAESGKSLRSVHKWQPPLLGPLPDTFLRIPQQLAEGLESVESSTAHDASMLEDERIAMFLQNEEFMAELRWNQDFLTTLENDAKLQGTGIEKCSCAANHDDEDLFKERLRNMGKVSRRKFAQLTKVFTRSKKRGGRQLLPPTASCDDLLDPEESSRPQT